MAAQAFKKPTKKNSAWTNLNNFFQITVGIAGILGLVISWLQYRSPTPAAFAESDLALNFGSFGLRPDVKNRVYLGANIKDRSGAYLIMLPLVVTNNGRGSIERITISSSFPEIIQHNLLEIITERLEGKHRKFIDYSSDSQVIDGRSIHTARFGPIEPGGNFGLLMPMPFTPSEVNIPFSVGGASLNAYVRYLIQVDFEVQAINGPKVVYKTEIGMVYAEDREQLKERVVDFESAEIRKERENWPWLKAQFYRQERSALRGFGAPNLISEAEGGRVYEIPVSAVSEDNLYRPAPGRFLLPIFSLIFVCLGVRGIWIKLVRSK